MCYEILNIRQYSVFCIRPIMDQCTIVLLANTVLYVFFVNMEFWTRSSWENFPSKYYFPLSQIIVSLHLFAPLHFNPIVIYVCIWQELWTIVMKQVVQSLIGVICILLHLVLVQWITLALKSGTLCHANCIQIEPANTKSRVFF